MRLQSWSLLATTLVLLSTRTEVGAGRVDFNAASSLSQVLLWDENWELTQDGGILTKNGSLIIMSNADEIFLRWAYPLKTIMDYRVTMDGNVIDPFRNTGGILGTTDVNGTTWETLQVSIRDTPEDHQLKFWVANPGGVIFTSFTVAFSGVSALPSTYGRYAASIPIDAVTTDSKSTRLNFSREGWRYKPNTSFCDQGTLANSSVIGSWVQFTVSGESDPSFWIYGVAAQRHSLANIEVIGYKYESVVYNESKVVRVGGLDNGEDSGAMVYQAPLFSRTSLPTADLYRVNITLQKGDLMIDFIRSMTKLLPYATPLNLGTIPSNGSSNEGNKALQTILLPMLLFSGVLLLLATSWFVWRYRFLVTPREKRAPIYIGKVVKEERTVMEVKPYIAPTSTPNSSSSTMALLPSDEKRRRQHDRSPVTTRPDQPSNCRQHHSFTPSFVHPSFRLSGDTGTGERTTGTLQTITSSSMLSFNVNSTGNGNGDEGEEPPAFSHEQLARMFDRVTELRVAQGLQAHERAAVLARREPEELETLARQLAGID
ncbi:hypothetical protein FRC14_005170 [Serendipita sp. 396]|nr:hypothetical protein FRC14_005170 [Serendipita sp. 396]KAG8772968.1 hypothetical protein FRC15_002362 [Serendipita sp. 397]KAG8787580.1 hypothetical protein FRC16_001528 [Serendipita sp. 398]KAG8828157.1 hypothetical protein FRC19_009241 [Serendipita sp. 401]KAG8829430.1 hypothetical protein FRC18_009324 [Serendipita sp. 400]KAG8845468.1 hypothetical protein FRB91_001734 [Serendipita sp. 411]KAG8851629.1 hypothetical protein FRC20_001684 [Serendipita sp. 405]KAG9058462.1 hypothetical prot